MTLNNKLDLQYLLISRTENRRWKTGLNVWKYGILSSFKIVFDKILNMKFSYFKMQISDVSMRFIPFFLIDITHNASI